MDVERHKLAELVFFFGIFGLSAYVVWMLFAPFLGAIALAAIIVTICYPLHERIVKRMPQNNTSLGALVSVLSVLLVIITPLAIIASLILREAVSLYTLFSGSDHITFIESLNSFETLIRTLVPSFSFDVASIIQQTAGFFVDHILSLFAGTASAVFLFFIALIASYYFFRDGKFFTSYMVQLSPLRDTDDARILGRLAVAVRSVALGTVLVAMIQGTLTAIGLSLFNFSHAILWGCVAAIAALIPAVGTAIVFVPAIAYLIYTTAYVPALLLALWAVLAVGLIDNLLGPYLMSKGNKMHPLLILLSVLGGISLIGPVGFILGPVMLSLFLVLLELYYDHFKRSN